MDYQKIKYFLKAAETLNFSEAARQMYITPQAYGKQIALLEQEMGVTLFERNTRKMQLTQSGQYMYKNLSGLIHNLEEEYERMCEKCSKRNRQIRVGVFNALSRKKVVLPIVTSILAEFPEQDIAINMCDMAQLQTDIKNGKIDICITTTHEKEIAWENCKAVTLKVCPAKIVVSDYHKWVVQDAVSIEDMKSCEFVKMDLPQFSEMDYFVQIPCKGQLAVQNYETMCFNLEQGECFTIMSAEIDSYVEESGKVFPLPWSPFDFKLELLYNEHNHHSFLPELCQFIQEVFEI